VSGSGSLGFVSAETSTDLKTNVHHTERVMGAPPKQHRVKLTGHVGADGEGVVTWCEHYVDGALKGCGPSALFLTGPTALRDLVDERIGGLFSGTMLWTAA
jgi:hypothetical protein